MPIFHFKILETHFLTICGSFQTFFSQLEKADERIISLEAEIRIIREEKKRAEEECQKLRDENYIFRDRLAEIANSHPSPTTSAYLTNEIEALANRVEELTSELGLFSKYQILLQYFNQVWIYLKTH